MNGTRQKEQSLPSESLNASIWLYEGGCLGGLGSSDGLRQNPRDPGALMDLVVWGRPHPGLLTL